jgi:putative transposase
MARRLRIQYAGALYHVINRGNYRRDLFETVGAAQAFERLLGELCSRYGWEMHAFALMRNHFHLAVTTPRPNLADGMHWLLTTYAVRFNRYRSESGHLYQGRYQSPIIEDVSALVRVVDYIHVNPVKAGIVPPACAADFRWSSFARFVKGPRPAWLSPSHWLAALEIPDSAPGWARYREHLETVASVSRWEEDERELCHTWAIGTAGWKKTLALEYRRRALELDLPKDEVSDLKKAHWESALDEELAALGRSVDQLLGSPRQAGWKVELAATLRQRAGAPYRWIAQSLAMGSPLAVRVAVCRLQRQQRASPAPNM